MSGKIPEGDSLGERGTSGRIEAMGAAKGTREDDGPGAHKRDAAPSQGQDERIRELAETVAVVSGRSVRHAEFLLRRACVEANAFAASAREAAVQLRRFGEELRRWSDDDRICGSLGVKRSNKWRKVKKYRKRYERLIA